MEGAVLVAGSVVVRPEGYAPLAAWCISSLTSAAIALAFWFVRPGQWLHEPNKGAANAEFVVSTVLTMVVLAGAILWSRRYARG